MKKLLTLIFILFYITSFAQNWQTVNSKRIAHFGLSKPDYYHPEQIVFETIAIDSVEVNGGDSIFYNFKTFYGDFNYCDNLTDTSWLGTHVIIKPNGDNLFFNKNGDTMRIKTLANISDNWDFTNGITATVNSISFDTIIDDIVDSVKTISLSDGNEIKISQYYGLLKSIRFVYYPISDSTVNIMGVDNIGGIQSAINFGLIASVGDEFHYFSVWSQSVDWEKEKSIHRITQVDTSTNKDTIFYKINRCIYKEGDGPSYGYTSSYRTDIITRYNLLSTNSSYSYISISDTNNPYDGGYSFLFYDSSFNGRIKKYNKTDFEYQNNCWSENIDSYSDYIIIEGLGNVSNFSGGFGSNSSNLVYFKKANGGEEWGTSLGTCATLGKEELINNQVSVYPNPTTNVLNIVNFNKSEVYIKMYNAIGAVIIDSKFTKSTQINTSAWQKGIYFLNIHNPNGELIKREKIVVQ